MREATDLSVMCTQEARGTACEGRIVGVEAVCGSQGGKLNVVDAITPWHDLGGQRTTRRT
jgi:hypothetical protein